jgi:hypothetical protein
MWSRWIDWTVLGDNLKYPPAFSQLGGVAPVPLYITLENGWKVRVQEIDGTTKITGNLLVSDLSSPFTPTIGAWNTQIILEAPLQAQAIEVNTGSGVTSADKTEIINGIASHATIVGIDSKSTDIKTKTDQLTFTTANVVDASASVSEAGIRIALGMASANLDAQLAAIPTDTASLGDVTSAIAAADIATETKQDLILADTNDLQTNQGNWLTATGFATVNPDNASIDEIKTRLDLNAAKPNTYADDGSTISNSDYTLTKTDN